MTQLCLRARLARNSLDRRKPKKNLKKYGKVQKKYREIGFTVFFLNIYITFS